MKAPPRPASELTIVRRLFRDVPLAHVATLDARGDPHVVPLWFVWLDDALFLTCREGSVVADNLARGGDVAVSIDRGLHWTEHQGVLVRGTARILPRDHSNARRALSAWFEKYAEHLSGTGFAAYTSEVEHPVVVRLDPDLLSTWGHAKEG
jgi:nitroimidazol reductase NimA-like FMN-containing flavoprotein (pyridoxamine 5'-phosphate oxidase superfamily)